MKDQYIKVLINHFLKKTGEDNILHVNSFLEDSGFNRVELLSYLRKNGWEEKTIGIWVLKY